MSETELTKVKARIRKLLERTADRGFTEAEMYEAMGKVGELLERFNLNMSEVLLRQENFAAAVYETPSQHRGVSWQVSRAVAAFSQTKHWFTKPRKKNYRWSFFGTESDRMMAVYLMDIINKAYATAYAEYKETDHYRNYGSHRKTLAANFLRGFGDRVAERLNEMANKRAEDEEEAAKRAAEEMKSRMVGASDEAIAKAAKATTGTELISVAKANIIEEEFAKTMGLKLRSYTKSNKYRQSSGAYSSGVNAGDKLNLSRPLTAKPNDKMLLIGN